MGVDVYDSGDKMAVQGGDTIYIYDLSTSWDASTASLNTSWDISGDTTNPQGLLMIDGGDQVVVADSTDDKIHWIELVDGLSGSAIVEWDTGVPSDIKSWDLATYQATLDGETVTVDILDGNDSVLHSDVSQNFDISTVANTKNVKIKANLSRASTSNNPTFDYAARRWVR